MNELGIEEFDRVKPLLMGTNCKLVFPYSVLEGKQPGKVFVDSMEHPQSVFIAHRGGNHYIAGSKDNDDFNQSMIRYLHKQQNHTSPFVDVFPGSEEWRKLLENKFRYTSKSDRYGFVWENNRVKGTLNIPAGFSLRKVNEGLLDMYSDIDRDYKRLWRSSKEYVKHGGGFCLLYYGQITAICNSIYVGNGHAEMDIITAKRFRGRGFGRLVATAFIKNCQKSDIKPYLEASVDNKASIHLAHSLGFEKDQDYVMYSKDF